MKVKLSLNFEDQKCRKGNLGNENETTGKQQGAYNVNYQIKIIKSDKAIVK